VFSRSQSNMQAIHIREVRSRDAPALAGLLSELGYPNTAQFVRRKLKAMGACDTVLVAMAAGQVVGFAHLHHTEMFHAAGRIGRVMALAVTENRKRTGVGRKLLAALEAAAHRAGCVRMEVTSGARRKDAHSFYRKLGYTEEPKRFVRRLE
jgi:GNAT superfamily N-acetyltransferase